MTRALRLMFGVLCLAICVSAASAQTRFQFQYPGADDDLTDALNAASLLNTAQADGTSAPQDLLAAAQADYARLLGALYANGRYGGVITIAIDGREAASLPLLSPPSQIRQITVRVDPGPLYTFSRAAVGPLPKGSVPPETYRRGLPATTGAIRDAGRQAIDAWRSDGHALARIANQQITARHAQRAISAQLGVSPGPRLRFGNVAITGNKNVRTARIRKIAGLEPGPVYDPAEVERAARRLRRTGSFSAVTIVEGDSAGPNGTLPLTIEVTEAVPRRFGVGAEYSTVDGVTLSGFWLHRNFLGGAERFRVDGEVAGIAGDTGGTDYSLGLRYERPATPRADIDLYAELQFESLDERDFQSDKTEFTLGLTRYATDELTVGLGIGVLNSETTDVFGTTTDNFLTFPATAELDRRDDTLDPLSGYYVDLEVTPFLGMSDSPSGTRIELDSRAYRSTERLTFAGRLQLGSLFGPSLIDSPAFYRFFSGGGGTVRGQDFQSLTVNVGGNRTGGRSFLGLSGELRARVTENIQVVGFADWGYVGTESFPDFSGESHAGAGLGLRYNTGIGPIRLDLATPVGGGTIGSGLFIYVGIGQAF